jgi:hypothetical protein
MKKTPRFSPRKDTVLNQSEKCIRANYFMIFFRRSWNKGISL